MNQSYDDSMLISLTGVTLDTNLFRILNLIPNSRYLMRSVFLYFCISVILMIYNFIIIST